MVSEFGLTFIRIVFEKRSLNGRQHELLDTLMMNTYESTKNYFQLLNIDTITTN